MYTTALLASLRYYFKLRVYNALSTIFRDDITQYTITKYISLSFCLVDPIDFIVDNLPSGYQYRVESALTR